MGVYSKSLKKKEKGKMSKYKIIKEFWFDAGHRMHSHDLLSDRGAGLLKFEEKELGWKRFKCSNPHGHTFHVWLVIEAQNLDKQNLVIDTDKIKKVISYFIEKYDHSYILDKNDPIKEDFINLFQGYRVVIIDGDPTAERIAKEVYDFFDEKFKEMIPNEYPKEFRIREVRLKMATTLVAIYSPYENE